MSGARTLREIGIDCLGVDPFLKKIGLDGNLTVEELQRRLRLADLYEAIVNDGQVYYCPHSFHGSHWVTIDGTHKTTEENVELAQSVVSERELERPALSGTGSPGPAGVCDHGGVDQRPSGPEGHRADEGPATAEAGA